MQSTDELRHGLLETTFVSRLVLSRNRENSGTFLCLSQSTKLEAHEEGFLLVYKTILRRKIQRHIFLHERVSGLSRKADFPLTVDVEPWFITMRDCKSLYSWGIFTEL